MFSNRVFNAALLISLTWHLICMFTVNIVVLPGKYRTRELTSVSFLGPILGKTALEIILANKPVAVTTRYRRGLKYKHTIDKKEKLLIKNDVKKHIDIHAENSIGRALDRVFRKDKEIPNIVTKTSGREAYFKGSGEISRHILNREVIYKPEEPKLPAWIAASSPFRMELEFIISVHGEVEEVVPVVSSGSAEVDLLGIRYLKNWRFAPLAQSSDKRGKGRVKFIFERK